MQLLSGIFLKVNNMTQNFTWKEKGSRIAKILLKKKNWETIRHTKTYLFIFIAVLILFYKYTHSYKEYRKDK